LRRKKKLKKQKHFVVYPHTLRKLSGRYQTYLLNIWQLELKINIGTQSHRVKNEDTGNDDEYDAVCYFVLPFSFSDIIDQKMKKLFGGSGKDQQRQSMSASFLSTVVFECCDYLELHAPLPSAAVFQTSGSVSQIDLLHKQGSSIKLTAVKDVTNVVGLLKRHLKENPSLLQPFASFVKLAEQGTIASPSLRAMCFSDIGNRQTTSRRCAQLTFLCPLFRSPKPQLLSPSSHRTIARIQSSHIGGVDGFLS
jgi:hypothetical protein